MLGSPPGPPAPGGLCLAGPGGARRHASQQQQQDGQQGPGHPQGGFPHPHDSANGNSAAPWPHQQHPPAPPPGGGPAAGPSGPTSRGPKPFLERVRVVYEVAQGLLALESLQPPLLHRDIKPSNIFIDGGGHARVSAWHRPRGSAHEADSTAMPGSYQAHAALGATPATHAVLSWMLRGRLCAGGGLWPGAAAAARGRGRPDGGDWHVPVHGPRGHEVSSACGGLFRSVRSLPQRRLAHVPSARVCPGAQARNLRQPGRRVELGRAAGRVHDQPDTLRVDLHDARAGGHEERTRGWLARGHVQRSTRRPPGGPFHTVQPRRLHTLRADSAGRGGGEAHAHDPGPCGRGPAGAGRRRN